jgi:hypothetical protein
MDLLCPKCGEPWDNDELHEVTLDEVNECLNDHGLPSIDGVSYHIASKLFRSYGCEVFGCSHGAALPKESLELVAMTYDLLGDDMDGAASMLDDAEYLGYL